MENTAWLESIVEYCHLILSLVYLDLSLDAISLRNNHQPSRLLIKCTSVVLIKDAVGPRCPRSPWYLPTNVLWRQLVRLGGVLGSFQLDLQSLHANLETVHRLNRRLRARRIVIRHETWNKMLQNTKYKDSIHPYCVISYVFNLSVCLNTRIFIPFVTH